MVHGKFAIPVLVAGLGLLVLPAVGTRAQSISAASPDPLPRSGRLVVLGTSFGAPTPGAELLIDGVPAIATTWTDTEIHGYVPESATFGTVPVQVVTPGGSSNVVNVTVVARQGSGRVLWRFRTDHSRLGGHLAVGADGIVYTSDSLGLYALAPDGALLWFQAAGRGGRQVSVGADGTVYAGQVTAVAPDGSVKWQFVPPVPGPQQLAGPAVGADGNIYAVQEDGSGGLGVFSLDPAGNLRWQRSMNPSPNADLNNGKVQFGAGDQFYFGVSMLRSGPWQVTYGFDFTGKQVWHHDGTCSTGPVVDDLGRVLMTGAGNCGLSAFDQNGNLLFNAPPPDSVVFPLGPAPGPDGSVYVSDWTGAAMWSYAADGSLRWALPSSSARGIMKNLAVTPDNRYLLDGGRLTFGVPGWIKAYSTADGSDEWQVDLPREQGMDQETNSVPEFSPTGGVAYYNTAFFGNGPGYAYVYAIDVCEELASWRNYGSGWAGTLGVPSLTSQGDPVLGDPIDVDLGNSRGQPTRAWILTGLASLSVPTNLGGTLLVDPLFVFPSNVPAGGLTLSSSLPSDPKLCGISLFLQALQLDPGASKGVSFTPGLELRMGL